MYTDVFHSYMVRMLCSLHNKTVDQGFNANIPQVAHYHLHEQGQYQGRRGKVTRSGTKKYNSHNL